MQADNAHLPLNAEKFFQKNAWAKDYRLNGYPQLPNGAPAMYSYEDYVAWLADYLFSATIKLHPEQEAIVAQLLRLDSAIAFRLLGGHAGGDAAECEERPHFYYPDDFNVEDGDIFNLRLVNPDDEVIGEEVDIDQSCLRAFVREDFAYHQRYQRELRDFNKFWPLFIKRWSLEENTEPGLDEPADAGWRILLAALLKQITDKPQRIAFLNLFFDEFSDAVLG